MAPFLACSLGFGLVVVDPGFVSCNDSRKEAITLCFKAPQKFFTSVNASLFQFWSEMPWQPPCRHFAKLKHVMNNVMC
jgi:hypothetical protein